MAAALTVNEAIKLVAQALDPSLARMPQLQAPLIVLTLEGAVAAVILFAVFAWRVPRPIFWYRTFSVVALLLSLVPDLALGLGGTAAQMTLRLMGSLTSLGTSGAAGSLPGGVAPGAPPPGPGSFPGTSWEQVLLLMVLHAATALVCVVLLTTATRRRATITRRVRHQDGLGKRGRSASADERRRASAVVWRRVG